MTNKELMNAHFYQAYGNIDIWRIQDTVAGKNTFFFYNNGQIIEKETEAEILILAKFADEEKRGR